MSDVNVDISTGSEVNRVEVIIRIFYLIPVAIVLYIFLIIAYILWLINFWTCLILAKRIAPEFLAKVVKQITKVFAYMMYITDERPPIVP